MNKIIPLILSAIGLAGCSTAYRVDLVSARVLDWGGGNSIYVVDDAATGTRCWAYSRGGLACAHPAAHR